MIQRILANKMLSLAQKYQVITLTGPRQSGKTTLVRAVFSSLPYVSLEEPDIRQIALTDPRGFLANYHNGAILDEVQHIPDLFSYIQSMVDRDPKPLFILTGSSNFLLMEKISQTLAGRTAVLHLLPLSLAELLSGGYTFEQYEALIYQGQYPRIYDRSLDPPDFFPAYIQTYVERDVRLMKNIGDANAFIQFCQLCAGRIGQLLNYTSLANDAGISPNTAKAWLSILEASFVLYRLQPYHKNFNKRLVKSPKLYFYDTGLACSLLGLREASQVSTHFLRGALFENLVINEAVKYALHRGEHRYPYFWQDSRGKEIDCLIVDGEVTQPIEIKAGKTLSEGYFSNLRHWRALTGMPPHQGCVIYGGDQSMQTSAGALIGWQEMNKAWS